MNGGFHYEWARSAQRSSSSSSFTYFSSSSCAPFPACEPRLMHFDRADFSNNSAGVVVVVVLVVLLLFTRTYLRVFLLLSSFSRKIGGQLQIRS